MVHPLRALLSFLSVVALALPSAAQKDPAKDPAKGPDKEVAEKIALLKEVVADKKFTRDADGLQVIDQLLQKTQAQPGPDPKDQKDIVKALEHVLSQGKARPSIHTKSANSFTD